MVLTIKKARLLSELTQKEVAAKLDVHTHTYMKWEKQPQKMSIENAKKLSAILSLGIDDIFFEAKSNLNG